MGDLEPQTAAAKVLWHFTMSLDGFVAGPEHDMHWLTGFAIRPGLIEVYTRTTGAVLAGRDGFDSAIGDARPYGGAWQGPVFVLTHHPQDARPADGITVLSCPVEEAVRIALDAAGGKNVEVFSPNIGRQLLGRGLIDEIDLHIAPVLLGAGIRLYDNPADDRIIRLHRVGGGDPVSTVNVRYRPLTAGTARAAAAVRDQLSGPHWQEDIAGWIPPDIAGQLSWDLFGLITGLPAGSALIPWDGPPVRIIEHQAHAPGHAALLIGERGVLIAGDMLSDVLIPMLDFSATADPIEDYLAALRLLEGAAGDADDLIPGHESAGGPDQERAQAEMDRAYVHALRGAGVPGDPRVGPSATFDWMPGVHERQLQHLARRSERGGTPG